jgi:hypothetical protein
MLILAEQSGRAPPTLGDSLDGDALGEIARLVHVAAEFYGGGAGAPQMLQMNWV